MFLLKITVSAYHLKEFRFVCNRIQYFSTVSFLSVVLSSPFRQRSKAELSAIQWLFNQVAACGTDLAWFGFEVLLNFVIRHEEKQNNSLLNGSETVCVLVAGSGFKVSIIHIVHFQKSDSIVGISQSNRKIGAV